MGHIRTGPLPATRSWKEVVGLLAGGAAAAQLATATAAAAERGLRAAPDDPGVVEALWLLVRLPLAARSRDFVAALRGCGLNVPADPGLLDISVAYTAAVEARMPDGRGRTDLGEMALTAGAETINAVVGNNSRNLFGVAPDEVRRAFAALATEARFGAFARQFFARFTTKCLSYFLSKAMPAHVGPGKRFRTVADQSRFTDALDAHCREAAVIVEGFAGEWFGKHGHKTAGEITREETQGFVGYATATKLVNEFRNREGRRGS